MRHRWSIVLALIAALALVALAMRGCSPDDAGIREPGDAPTAVSDESEGEPGTRVRVDVAASATNAPGETRCTLRAIVIDIDGAPVPDAIVVVRTSRGNDVSGRSDAEGRVVIGDLPSGNIRMGLEIDGWREQYPASDGWTWLPSDLEHVLMAPALALVHGRVADEGGRPVGGAIVGLGMHGWFDSEVDYVTHTADDGTYRLGYVPEDIAAQSFVAAWAPGRTVDSQAFSDLQALAAGGVTRRDFQLAPTSDPVGDEGLAAQLRDLGEPSGDVEANPPSPLPEMRVVRARVVDTEGAPIAGAWVSTGSRGQVARTAADGTFAAPIAESDSLGVAAVGHVRFDRSLGWDDGSPEDVVLARRFDVRARLVFDDDGAPVIGAFAILGDARAVSDTEGVLTFRGVSPEVFDSSDVWFFVTAGRRDLPQPVEGPIEGLTADDLDEIRVQRGASLTARVLGPDGAPLPGAWAWVETHELDCGGAFAGPDGRFTLAGLPQDSELRVAVMHESFEFVELYVTLAEARADPELTLRFPAAGRMSGKLRLPEGHAHGRDLTIAAVPESVPPAHVRPMTLDTEIAEDGTFELIGVAGVAYRLMLRPNPDLAQRLTGNVVVRGDSIGNDVAALAGVSISGRIADGYGPLPNAQIRVRGSVPGSGHASTTSHEGGAFRIDGVEDGLVYRVHYKKSEHDPSWHALPDVVGGATDVVLEVP